MPNTTDGDIFAAPPSPLSPVTEPRISAIADTAILENQFISSTAEPAVLSPVAGVGWASRFLSFLAFEGHSVRLGLELSLCVLLFAVLDEMSLHSPISPAWQSLAAWSAACLLTAFVDHFIFLPPLFAYRKACGLDAMARFPEALNVLESIGPKSARVIRYPAASYYLHRALFLSHAGAHTMALHELVRARTSGLPLEAYSLTRIELLKANGALDAAQTEVAAARRQLGDIGSLVFVEAMIELDGKKNLSAAKQKFEQVMNMPACRLPSGISTHDAAAAFRQVCRLWTGHAEEALDALSTELSNLVMLTRASEAVRPMLARLHLERGRYFATHKEPELARIDLRIAYILSAHEEVKAAGRLVEEELEWRYNHRRPVS